MMQSIDNFFREYAMCFAKEHIQGIANAYSFPTCFYTSTGMSVVMNEVDFYKNFEEIIKVYDRLNMNNPSHEIISIKKLNPGIDLVQIRWDFFEENKKIVSFTTNYIMGESDKKMKILGVFEVDEHDKINELETAKKK